MISIISTTVYASHIDKTPDTKKHIIKTEYRFNSKLIEYSDSTSNLIIGGQIYADSKGIRIEDVKSLRDCEFCNEIDLIVDLDTKYPLEVLDYNSTNLTANLMINYLDVGKDIPLKVHSKGNESDIHKSIPIKFKSVQEKKTITLPFGFDKVIKWGRNSTTIKLQTANTENLDDSYVSEASPTSNYGTESTLSMNDESSVKDRDFAIKYNITSIPSGQTIDKSELFVWIYANFLDLSTEGYYAKSHHITGIWSEEGITWNNMPAYDGTPISSYRFFGGAGEPDDIWINWTVTSILNTCYGNSDTDCSILIKATDYFGLPSSDYTYFFTKEYPTDTSLRPYLNITYSEAGAGDSCSWPAINNNWEINCSHHCNVTTPGDIGAGNITYVGSGPVFFNTSMNYSQRAAPAAGCQLTIGSGFHGLVG